MTTDSIPTIRTFYDAEFARRGWQNCSAANCSTYLLNGRGKVSAWVYHQATDWQLTGAAITVQVYALDIGYNKNERRSQPAICESADMEVDEE